MKQSSPQKAPAQTLAALLAAHPEITGMTWSLDPSGVIHGASAEDDGSTIARLARIIGGTPLTRTTANPVGDLLTLTELVTIWHGSHFDVWTTHETPADVEAARPLGALVPALTGGAR
ncbi:hypothetical protein ACFU6S_06480 [Streptomyces sp. NPDC057456]|uniref:hypothetical protein n=1 Tax=Streptomyces sp. NPDC057456 TaxID=3346139 RepID=UPI00367C42EB